MAEAQREWLTEERSVLATRVVSLRDRFQQELSLVRADQDKARKLWGDLVAPAAWHLRRPRQRHPSSLRLRPRQRPSP